MRPEGTGLARGRVEGRRPSILRKYSKFGRSVKLRRRVRREDGSEPSDLASIPEIHWIRRRCMGFKPLDIHTFQSSGFGAARDFGVAASRTPGSQNRASHWIWSTVAREPLDHEYMHRRSAHRRCTEDQIMTCQISRKGLIAIGSRKRRMRFNPRRRKGKRRKGLTIIEAL
jgi:hypothetical protein